MKTKKISLASMQGVLSREDMKQIMGGGTPPKPTCQHVGFYCLDDSNCGIACSCNAAFGSCVSSGGGQN